MTLKLRKYKIGEQSPRCKICNQKVSIYIQEQYEHINKFHLQDLTDYGILPNEIEKFKDGFKWDQSTNNLPL